MLLSELYDELKRRGIPSVAIAEALLECDPPVPSDKLGASSSEM
jgi:hypothetical protein